jgi:hypothetical protein
MPDDDVYIVHMGHPTDPFDYGTACGAPWPDGPGPLDPGLVIPPEGIRVDPPAHLRPDQIVDCQACRRIVLGSKETQPPTRASSGW